MDRPAELSFGTGIYSFPAAAKLLARRQPGLQPGTLRYWTKTGLTPASYGKAPSGSDLLSFHDLVPGIDTPVPNEGRVAATG